LHSGSACGGSNPPWGIRDKSLCYKELRRWFNNNYRKNSAITPSKYGSFFSNGRRYAPLFLFVPKQKGLFIVEFVNPETGVRVCFRNTQTRDRDEALLTAARWQHDGIPKVNRGRKPVFQRQNTQTVTAVKDLSTVLKTLEKLPNLDPMGAQQIAEVLRDRGLLEFPTVKAGPGQINFIEYLEKFWDYYTSPYVKDKIAHNHTIGRKYCHGNKLKVTRFWKEHFSGRILASITRAELKKFSLELAKNEFSASYLNGIMKAATIPLTYAYNTAGFMWIMRSFFVVVSFITTG
jgi:hypothetical protein